jgi:hypothetical protein
VISSVYDSSKQSFIFSLIVTCGQYYKHMTIVNDDSSIVNKLEALLTDDARGVIYDRRKFYSTGHCLYHLQKGERKFAPDEKGTLVLPFICNHSSQKYTPSILFLSLTEKFSTSRK